MRFKGGKRSSMSVVERAFARIYDRLRKRAFRQRNGGFIDHWTADGYLAGVRDALDAVAHRLEQEGVVELAELRGSGV